MAEPTSNRTEASLSDQSQPSEHDTEFHGRMTIVVAVSENGVIGRDQQLPWHLSSDLQRFKKLTMANVLLMGRKTFDTIGRPLPGRTTIVLTRQSSFVSPGVLVANSMEQALSMAPREQHVFVVGGAEIYNLALPSCDRMFVTRVLTSVEGDSFFAVPETGWVCVNSTPFPSGPKDDFPTIFEEWHRSPIS
jgi:dihydrofolate reductase